MCRPPPTNFSNFSRGCKQGRDDYPSGHDSDAAGTSVTTTTTISLVRMSGKNPMSLRNHILWTCCVVFSWHLMSVVLFVCNALGVNLWILNCSKNVPLFQTEYFKNIKQYCSLKSKVQKFQNSKLFHSFFLMIIIIDIISAENTFYYFWNNGTINIVYIGKA